MSNDNWGFESYGNATVPDVNAGVPVVKVAGVTMFERGNVGAVATFSREREVVEWRIIPAAHAVTKFGASMAALNRCGAENPRWIRTGARAKDRGSPHSRGEKKIEGCSNPAPKRCHNSDLS